MDDRERKLVIIAIREKMERLNAEINTLKGVELEEKVELANAYDEILQNLYDDMEEDD